MGNGQKRVYPVTTGWNFDTSLLCENSINQSIDIFMSFKAEKGIFYINSRKYFIKRRLLGQKLWDTEAKPRNTISIGKHCE